MVRLIELTEVTGRDFSGQVVATAEVHVSAEHIIAIRPVGKNTSLLVLQGTAPVTIVGQPRDIIAHTRLYSQYARPASGYVPKMMPLQASDGSGQRAAQ